MVMRMRNFWVEAEVDGRATDIGFGPSSKDGGFSLTVYQRENGQSVRALDITGEAHEDGVLHLFLNGKALNIGLDSEGNPNGTGYGFVTQR